MASSPSSHSPFPLPKDLHCMEPDFQRAGHETQFHHAETTVELEAGFYPDASRIAARRRQTSQADVRWLQALKEMRKGTESQSWPSSCGKTTESAALFEAWEEAAREPAPPQPGKRREARWQKVLLKAMGRAQDCCTSAPQADGSASFLMSDDVEQDECSAEALLNQVDLEASYEDNDWSADSIEKGAVAASVRHREVELVEAVRVLSCMVEPSRAAVDPPTLEAGTTALSPVLDLGAPCFHLPEDQEPCSTLGILNQVDLEESYDGDWTQEWLQQEMAAATFRAKQERAIRLLSSTNEDHWPGGEAPIGLPLRVAG